jgi:hypothetical protein
MLALAATVPAICQGNGRAPGKAARRGIYGRQGGVAPARLRAPVGRELRGRGRSG